MTGEEMAARLAERLRVEEFADVQAAFVFGSVSANRAHRESGLDVGVLLDRTAHPSPRDRFERRLILLSRLAGSAGRRALDLVVVNDLPPGFARRIVTEGRMVHCSDPEATHAFVRDTQLRSADLEPFLRRMRATPPPRPPPGAPATRFRARGARS